MEDLDNPKFALISGFSRTELNGVYERMQAPNDGKPSFKSEKGFFLYFNKECHDWNIAKKCGEPSSVEAWVRVQTKLPPTGETWNKAGDSKIRIVYCLSLEGIKACRADLIVSTLHIIVCL